MIATQPRQISSPAAEPAFDFEKAATEILRRKGDGRNSPMQQIERDGPALTTLIQEYQTNSYREGPFEISLIDGVQTSSDGGGGFVHSLTITFRGQQVFPAGREDRFRTQGWEAEFKEIHARICGK